MHDFKMWEFQHKMSEVYICNGAKHCEWTWFVRCASIHSRIDNKRWIAVHMSRCRICLCMRESIHQKTVLLIWILWREWEEIVCSENFVTNKISMFISKNWSNWAWIVEVKRNNTAWYGISHKVCRIRFDFLVSVNFTLLMKWSINI